MLWGDNGEVNRDLLFWLGTNVVLAVSLSAGLIVGLAVGMGIGWGGYGDD